MTEIVGLIIQVMLRVRDEANEIKALHEECGQLADITTKLQPIFMNLDDHLQKPELKTGSAEGKMCAAGALWNLSYDIANAPLIVQGGGIGPLIELLKTGSTEGKTYAATALLSLSSCDDPTIKASIAEGLAI
jgi:hypothetical protein